MRRSFVMSVLLLAGALAVTGCSEEASTAEPKVDAEVVLSRLLADVEAGVLSKDLAGLCDELSDPAPCEEQAAEIPRRAVPQPGATRSSIREAEDGSQVADLSGNLLNGQQFSTSVTLVDADGQAVELYPFYWLAH